MLITKEKTKWIEEEWELNYFWETKYHNESIPQKIVLTKPTVLKERGDCKSTFNGVAHFNPSQFIDNNYFLQSVAEEEIEQWAKIVDRTIGLRFLRLSNSTSKEILYFDRQTFTAKLMPVLMNFTNSASIKLWCFNIVWKNKKNILPTIHFPRYYVFEDNARKEMKQWILAQYLKNRAELKRKISNSKIKKFYLKTNKNRPEKILKFLEKHPNKWFSSNDVCDLVFPNGCENPPYILTLLRELESERKEIKKIERRDSITNKYAWHFLLEK